MHLLPCPLGVALVALSCPALAQIETEGLPAAISAGLRTEAVPVEFVQPPDVARHLAEDAARTTAGPLRYGALLDVDVDPWRNGVWDELADGTLVWRLRLVSPGAKSIGLEFSDYRLPDGAQVFLYDETVERVHGAYGAVNNQPHDQLQFAPFPGDSVIFEYVQPPTVEGSPRLTLGTVIYDYRDLFALEAQLDGADGALGGSGAGSCLIDVNCPEGDPYELLKHATLRTLSGGGLCSGALVNNTAEDETGYVLTAWHCGQSSNTVFRFNYQTGGCGSGSAPTNQQVSGCTVLASDNPSDGRLLRINTAIPDSYDPYYAGWNRSTQNPTFCVSMHHPAGGTKKISIDGDGASKAITFIIGIGNVFSWQTQFVGGFQGGSSGGPLFDQNNLLRGNLSGGPQTSCATSGSYGRFYNFWNADSLGQWLDPLGIGLTSLAGFDPDNPGPGPGGTVPEVGSISPPSIEAVEPNAPLNLTLSGTGFEGISGVTVNGQPLAAFPPEFQVVTNSLMTVLVKPPFNVGTLEIKIIEDHLDTVVAVPVNYNEHPTIDLVNSDPGFILTALPIEVYMGSEPGDAVFLLASTSALPSSLPGVLDADIGNGLTELFVIGNYVVDQVTGYAKVELPVGPLPIGTKLYFQAGVISAASPTLPLSMTNVESGTVLF